MRVEITDAPPRLSKGSTLVAHRVYYLPTYIHEKENPDGSSWLFLRYCIVWLTRGGRRMSRVVTGVREYPDGDAMVNDIEGHPDWLEAPAEADGNPQWMPEDLRA